MTRGLPMECGHETPCVEIRCPECERLVAVPCAGKITSHDLVMDLISGSFNQAACPGCGGVLKADVPVRVEISDSPIPMLRYVPFRSLEDPVVLDSILAEPGSTRIVHSMGELERAIEASLLLEQYRLKRDADPSRPA